jgi:flagellar assembly factor FliW
MTSVAHDDPSTLELTTRTVSSVILGEVEAAPGAFMAFPTPLWGFPEHAEFALLPAARDGLWWMQSTHDASLIFLLADPFTLDTLYGIDLGESERAALDIQQPSDAFGLVMITLPADGEDGATANFRAPIVFNVGKGTGMQVVSRDDTHALRRPVNLDVFPLQPAGLKILAA